MAKTSIDTKVRHVTTGCIFEDFGFSTEESALLRAKAQLHLEIRKRIEKQKLSARDLEKVLDVPQPRVSELLTGKISKMSLDKLTKYLYRLGREVKVSTIAVEKSAVA